MKRQIIRWDPLFSSLLDPPWQIQFYVLNVTWILPLYCPYSQKDPLLSLCLHFDPHPPLVHPHLHLACAATSPSTPLYSELLLIQLRPVSSPTRKAPSTLYPRLYRLFSAWTLPKQSPDLYFKKVSVHWHRDDSEGFVCKFFSHVGEQHSLLGLYKDAHRQVNFSLLFVLQTLPDHTEASPSPDKFVLGAKCWVHFFSGLINYRQAVRTWLGILFLLLMLRCPAP